ncbi:MAG: histidinol dehydrogenase [Bacteroidetes bacterium]|nr:histidinol dehydrogenase [Bacteroidota bacterium]
MRTYINPNPTDWQQIVQRPAQNNPELETVVKPILEAVRRQGDQAVKEYTRLLDHYELAEIKLAVPKPEKAAEGISPALKTAIDQACQNIKKYHESQLLVGKPVETMPGVKCWWEKRPIEKVGLYIPGGTAPLISTILMLGIPARLAGCKELVLCTPPNADGSIHPAMIYAASILDIKEVLRIGGAQAIAAMGYGTQTVPKVDKIYGPGNQYVTLAKQLMIREGVAIDMPAGPSEVLVLADATADPVFLAADLLSQAEHGTDSQAVFVCLDKSVFEQTLKETQRLCARIPRKDIAQKSLDASPAILLDDLGKAVELINQYAPEHLIINVGQADKLVPKIAHAGSVFLGPWSPESVGDYASGTNHTLPTSGYARAYSGLGVDDFQKTISFQKLDKGGLENIANTVMDLAFAERLEAHKLAVEVRLEKLKQEQNEP